MTAPRWEPDELTVDAVLASPRSSRDLTDMETLDRCWLVAGLGLAGMKAEDVAERTGCCLRLVRTIRAEPATMMAEVALAKTDEAFSLLNAEKSSHALTRRELAEARRESARLRMQLDQIVDQLTTRGKVPTFPRCGHPRVDFNIGTRIDRSGTVPKVRELCNQCNRTRVNRCRTKQRQHQ